jgi:cell division protein FtsQ
MRSETRRHGGAVTAPAEDSVLVESPPSPKVTGKGKERAVGTGSLVVERVFTGLKLLAGLLVVVASSSAVAFSLHRYAVTTARFGIQNVVLDGGRRLTPTEVRGVAGIEVGKNLFSFDTRAAEERLLANPWVASAKVTRELPSTLRIKLSEREASAIALLGDRSWLVTRDGEPFKELAEDDPLDLPVVTGVTAADLARDRTRATERLRVGLDLLRQYERLAASRVHPAQEVSLGIGGRVSLVVGRTGTTLELGRPPHGKKLAMAERILGELGRRSRSPAIVFLDNEAHPERVVVRMR